MPGWGAEPGSGDRSVHGRQALSHSLGRNSVSRAQSTDRHLHGSSPEQKGDSAQSGAPGIFFWDAHVVWCSCGQDPGAPALANR